MTDNQFTPIADEISPTLLNVCAPNEHVGDIEVFVRTLKERAQPLNPQRFTFWFVLAQSYDSGSDGVYHAHAQRLPIQRWRF